MVGRAFHGFPYILILPPISLSKVASLACPGRKIEILEEGGTVEGPLG